MMSELDALREGLVVLGISDPPAPHEHPTKYIKAGSVSSRTCSYSNAMLCSMMFFFLMLLSSLLLLQCCSAMLCSMLLFSNVVVKLAVTDASVPARGCIAVLTA